ncbi:hypothetical protein Tco_0736718 [Tanacetum coccineum]
MQKPRQLTQDHGLDNLLHKASAVLKQPDGKSQYSEQKPISFQFLNSPDAHPSTQLLPVSSVGYNMTKKSDLLTWSKRGCVDENITTLIKLVKQIVDSRKRIAVTNCNTVEFARIPETSERFSILGLLLRSSSYTQKPENLGTHEKSRTVRGGAKAQQLSRLLETLEPVILSNMEDRWVWDMNGDGIFRVKDVRNLLDDTVLPKDESPTRWIKCVPIKINIFAWKVYLDRLPTRLNLSRRGVESVVGEIWRDLLSAPIQIGSSGSNLFEWDLK